MTDVVILKKQEALLAQISGAFEGSEVILKYLHGVEAISELFEFKAVFLAENNSIDLQNVLGTKINIAIKSISQERYIDGIVAEISHGATESKNDIYLTEYTAIIRPRLWLLTLDRNHLMFQKKSAIDIINQVLEDNGITDLNDKTKSCGKVERDYCIQYDESSFNFISRLMEDEGIFYFFEHTNNKHTLVLADTASILEKTQKTPNIKFLQSSRNALPLGKIFDTLITASVNTGGYSSADYNYTISQTKLHSKLDTKWKGKEYYEFPGIYEKLQNGDDLSKLRVELFEFNRCLFSASSTVANLTPGFSFKLTDHHLTKFNKEYIAYNVEHFYEATASKGYIYKNNFKAFPKDTEFRPLRKSRKPRIYGTQTAIVVCPAGEEIYRNEHCCVKVHFHWDQVGKDKDTDDSSCWIRVAQLCAGNSWGAIFIPRVGQEVVVSFIEGDPDRPLIVGCVYNDHFMPPYSDTEAMLSCIKSAIFKDDEGKKFNEIRLNDEKDKEEIYVHAEKDMHVHILNSRKTEIEECDDTLDLFKGSRTITLKSEGSNPANHSLFLAEGDSIVELTDGDHKFTITKGNESISLSNGNRTVTLSGGDLSYNVTGNYSLEVSGNLDIKVGGNINIESRVNMDLSAGANLSASANANMILGANVNFEASGKTQATISGMIFEAAGDVQASLSAAMVRVAGTGMTQVSAPMITVGGGMLQLG